MRISTDLTLHPRSNEGPEGSQSEILIAGQRSGSVIKGQVLEAAVDCAGKWLLFVTDDVPYEEFLRIYLWDAKEGVLDSACIGSPYSTGTFSQLRLEPPHTVHFHFIDEAEWSVRIRETLRWALPWWPDTRGVWRGRRFRRHFEIQRNSKNRS